MRRTVPAAFSEHHKRTQDRLRVDDSGEPIYNPEWESQEVCHPPGSKVQDVAECLPQLVRRRDYCLLLLVHMGMIDTTTCNLSTVEQQVKNFGAKVIFTSILPIRNVETTKTKCIKHIKLWLCH